MQPQNHACRFEKIFKTKLQAFGRSDPETLRSQNHRRFKIRLLVKGLQVVHGQLSVSDQGGGPDPTQNTTGLGTQLVEALVRQLNGTIARQKLASGYTVTVTVPNK
jgi:two-component sensor histidine kinase